MKTIKCGYKLLRDSNIYHLYHLYYSRWQNMIECICKPFLHTIWLHLFINLSFELYIVLKKIISCANVHDKEKKGGTCNHTKDHTLSFRILVFFCFAPDSKIFHLKSLDFVPWLWLWSLNVYYRWYFSF